MIKELPPADHNHGHDDFVLPKDDRAAIDGNLGIDYIIHEPGIPVVDRTININSGYWDTIYFRKAE